METLRRALLLGRDPNFAWALQRILDDHDIRLEHVYTVSEARMRIDRHPYLLCFIDGLRLFEIESFVQDMQSTCRIILVDVDMEKEKPCDCPRMDKSFPLEAMKSTLQTFLT